MNEYSLRDYLELVLKARVYAVAQKTPLDRLERLSRRLRSNIVLKREDQQSVFSFKLRGAYNKMCNLSAEELAAGVVCASAGNHAQGVALAAKHLRCRAVIVMPVTTPKIKIEAVKALGGEVLLVGDSYQEAQSRALELETQENLTLVHPYDDPYVIAGQGTIGLEILQQHPDAIDAIFVPIGGGGLISGIGAVIKKLYPEVNVVGVEPDDAASMKASLAAGERLALETVGLFADGVAVKQVGTETFRICQQVVDDVITVTTDEICAAIKDVYEDTRTILEPAGALATAGIKKYLAGSNLTDQNLVGIACGANMNFDRLRHVAERAELGEQREALLAVTIPEEPGSFRAFCTCLGSRNITEFNYRYASSANAHVFTGIEVEDHAEVEGLIAYLSEQGLPAVDLSTNELAKVHVRHMVGGRAGEVGSERFFRFEFPERPGALGRFLGELPASCNITLFHYRNHSTDTGRVFVGLQIPEDTKGDFQSFLGSLGFVYQEETENLAVPLFL